MKPTTFRSIACSAAGALALCLMIGSAAAAKGEKGPAKAAFQTVKAKHGHPFLIPANSTLKVEDKGGLTIFRAAPAKPAQYRWVYFPGATPLGMGVANEAVIHRLAAALDHLGVPVEIHSMVRPGSVPKGLPLFSGGHSAGMGMAHGLLSQGALGMIDIGSAEGGRGVPLVLKSGGQTVVKLEGADHSLRRQTPETLKLGYEGQRVAADISRETWEMNLKLAGEIKAFMEKAAGGKGK